MQYDQLLQKFVKEFNENHKVRYTERDILKSIFTTKRAFNNYKTKKTKPLHKEYYAICERIEYKCSISNFN